MILGDGRCFIQVILAPGFTSGKATSTQVGQAAFNTYSHCVVKYGYGGIAAQIGECVISAPEDEKKREISFQRLSFRD